MNKLAVLSTVILCFLIYTVMPLIMPLLLLSTSTISAADILALLLWGTIFIAQLISIYQVIKKNKKWLHVFFVSLFIGILLSISDYLLLTLERSDIELDIIKVVDDLIFPIFAMWVVYFSDAKDFFNVTKECRNE